MAKRNIGDITANDENVLNIKNSIAEESKPKLAVKKIRTSMVFDVSIYEYIKKEKRRLSIERDEDLTIEATLSIIVLHYKENNPI